MFSFITISAQPNINDHQAITVMGSDFSAWLCVAFSVLCSSGKAKRLSETKTSTSLNTMVDKDKEMRGNTLTLF
jgi:hypothetical protein